MDIKYGSEDAFNLIATTLEECDEWAAKELDAIIRKDMDNVIKLILFKKNLSYMVSDADREDIISEARIELWKHMSEQYLREKAGDDQVSRGGYLKTVAENKVNDFLRKKGSPIRNAEDIDDMYWIASEENIENQLMLKLEAINSLKALFNLNCRPDKLISMVYGNVLYSSAQKNGTPKMVAEEFEGVSIPEMYESMISDLEQFLGFGIPDDVCSPLREKVYSKFYNEVFKLTPSQITDSSYRITKKMKEKKND